MSTTNEAQRRINRSIHLTYRDAELPRTPTTEARSQADEWLRKHRANMRECPLGLRKHRISVSACHARQRRTGIQQTRVRGHFMDEALDPCKADCAYWGT
jgi:hypothetical protein